MPIFLSNATENSSKELSEEICGLLWFSILMFDVGSTWVIERGEPLA
jgi:hypothetical protein